MKRLIGKESGDIIMSDMKKKLVLLVDGEEKPCSYYIMEDKIILILNNSEE